MTVKVKRLDRKEKGWFWNAWTFWEKDGW